MEQINSRERVDVSDLITPDDDDAESLLAFVLGLGQQGDAVGQVPALNDSVAKLAGALRNCVERGHISGTECWGAVDIAAHIAASHPAALTEAALTEAGTLAEWVRAGLRLAERLHGCSLGRGVEVKPDATPTTAVNDTVATTICVPMCVVGWGPGPDGCSDRDYCSEREQPMCGAYCDIDASHPQYAREVRRAALRRQLRPAVGPRW